ncbi:hypothetical protein [Abyssalbus ytuae]|uniref:Uncharacterized protein n=1 Tax=Abyssalbus ytuae TaxID=2926907 RepID=A0A9E6ZPN7_9FLAO|nr:hypothetical protein [Abyssalbus ytuae]UOB18215.1 hypothetical protein MQE35_02690 [Abyssalbus ytuae]
MELANIEKLLEKYFEAQTTLAEEKILQIYFSQDNVAPHLEEYKSMFNYFSNAKKERFTKQVPLKTKKNNYLKWISVAAVAVLTIAVYFNYNKPANSLEEAYTQKELESAQKALKLFAANFNVGTQGVTYLSEFEKNTNRFLINK